MKKNTKRGISGGKIVAVGAGVAAIGAGAYYFLGSKGKKHQKQALVVMAKMKREALQKAVKAKNLTKPLYHKVVDTLATIYSEQYKAHEKDIKVFAKKLKSEWKIIEKEIAKKSVKSSKKKTH